MYFEFWERTGIYNNFKVPSYYLSCILCKEHYPYEDEPCGILPPDKYYDDIVPVEEELQTYTYCYKTVTKFSEDGTQGELYTPIKTDIGEGYEILG